jgi:uncharacterized membrane protein YphA (DoxX/SURF4 family)
MRMGMANAIWDRVRLPLTLAARLVLGLVFALSAVSKITASGAFRDTVAAYHLLPPGLVTPFALALPWIEALIALYLLVGLFLRPTAVVTAALLVVFTGALGISLARGATAHGCGCFGGSGPIGSFPPVVWLAGGNTITPFDVVRDVIFLLLAAAIYWGDRAAFSLDGLLFRPAMAAAEDEGDWDDAAEPEPAIGQMPANLSALARRETDVKRGIEGIET